MLNTPDHGTILNQIEQLLDVAAQRPEADDADMASALIGRGVPFARAWLLVMFVPLAFGRIVIEQLGVNVSDTYVVRGRFRNSTRKLRDLAEYRAAYDHLGDFSAHSGFKPLVTRSAEVNAASNALNAGKDISGADVLPVVVKLPRGVTT